MVAATGGTGGNEREQRPDEPYPTRVDTGEVVEQRPSETKLGTVARRNHATEGKGGRAPNVPAGLLPEGLTLLWAILALPIVA